MFKVGDRVRKEKVMKVQNAVGTIQNISKEYVVVLWDEVKGQWHYTHEQAQMKLEILNEQK